MGVQDTLTRTAPQSVEHFMAFEERLKMTRCKDESAQMYSGTSASIAGGHQERDGWLLEGRGRNERRGEGN